MKLGEIRRQYSSPPLRRRDLAESPVVQFERWFEEAERSEVQDLTAMAVATCDSNKVPSVRYVLLKHYDEHGFVFFTDYRSRKGRELTANPRAAAALYWRELNRQVRIVGQVERTDREVARQYFESRPRSSQIAASISSQTDILPSRQILIDAFKKAESVRPEESVALPDHWGGYRIVPTEIEFWQGREDRMHDRFRYTAEGAGAWRLERLYP